MHYHMYKFGLYLIYYIIRIAPPKRIVASYVGRLCEKGEPTSAGDCDEKNTPLITTLYTNTHIVCYLYKHTMHYHMYKFGLYLIY